MAKLLLADDEPRIRELLLLYAQSYGYEARLACDGAEALALCERETFDLAVLDIAMPRVNGVAAFRELKTRYHLPIIILSAYGEEYGKLFAFDMGVDDYMVKPFSPRELMARIGAILSRTLPSGPPKRRVLTHGPLSVDIDAYSVSIDSRPVALSPQEYGLLRCLIEGGGEVRTREQLVRAVWGENLPADDSVLDALVRRLRRRLGEHRDLIATERGVGYRLDGS